MAKETTLDPLYLGTDFAYVFTVKNEAETAAIDITGWALSFAIKKHVGQADVDALLTKTTVSGIALTTPASGVCTVTIADTDTDGLAPGMKVWELKRTNDGYETVLAYGTVELRRGVHRT